MHGGKSLAGVASATWRTGRYSKYMPTNLLAAFRERLADPSILALRSEIAVLQTRLGSLLDTVSRGGHARLWERLGAQWADFHAAQNAGDVARAAALLADIDRTITTGAADAGAWREIGDTIERIRRAVDTETRREVIAQDYVSRPLVAAVLVELGRLCRDNVHDQAALTAITEGLSRYLHSAAEAMEP